MGKSKRCSLPKGIAIYIWSNFHMHKNPLLGRMGFNPIDVVGAQPPTNCSSTLYLVGKMAILAAHECSSRSEQPNWFRSWKWPKGTTIQMIQMIFQHLWSLHYLIYLFFAPYGPMTQPQQRRRRHPPPPKKNNNKKKNIQWKHISSRISQKLMTSSLSKQAQLLRLLPVWYLQSFPVTAVCASCSRLGVGNAGRVWVRDEMMGGETALPISRICPPEVYWLVVSTHPKNIIVKTEIFPK